MAPKSPVTAVRYAEESIRGYAMKVRFYGSFYYGASVFSLLMGVAPGVIYAVLQLFKATTGDQTYNLVVLSTVICSSLASFATSVLNFLVVRVRFNANKQAYYALKAEYTLYKSGTGAYYRNPEAHLVMLARLTPHLGVKNAKEYDPHRKVWSINGRH